VLSFTADDCRRHLETHMLPSTLVVSIAGGFETEAAIAEIDEASAHGRTDAAGFRRRRPRRRLLRGRHSA